MTEEEKILEKHFGSCYWELEADEHLPHILNAMKENAKQKFLEALEEAENRLRYKLSTYDRDTSKYDERCAVWDCIKLIEEQRSKTKV